MTRRDLFGVPKSRLVPWLVLSLGLIATATVYVAVSVTLRQRNQKQFAWEMNRLEREVDQIIDDQVGVLYAVAGAIAANPNITRSEFREFYTKLRRGKAASVPTSMGFSIERPWKRRGELLAEAAQRGVPNFRLSPDAPRDVVHAVILLEPEEGVDPSSFGHDMTEEPIRRTAVDDALRTREPRMTSKIVLTRDRRTRKASFLLYAPVYAEGDPSKRIGIVHLGIRTADLFRPLETILRTDHVGLRLWSGTRNANDLVYEFQTGGRREQQKVASIELPQVGQKLEAEFLALPGFGYAAIIKPFVLPVGGLFSILLFALVSVLGRAQESSERREAHQKLLADVGQLTTDAVEDEKILNELAATIGSTLGATCRIDLFGDDGALRTVSTRPGKSQALEALEREYPRLKSDLLLKEALESGRAQLSNDGYIPTDEHHRERIDALGVGIVLIVPMKVRDRRVGAITLVRPNGSPTFSKDAVALTEAIASRTALALENARLYQAAQGEVYTTRMVANETQRMNDELERRVAERTRDLEASNEELESFCYSVSHDLRTPLRSLDGFSRALKEDYADRLDDQGIDFLDRIRAAAKRMDELITALLTLSRLTRSEILPAPADVSRIARDLVEELDSEGRVRFAIEDGLTVHADRRMVEILVENLLSNAVKFSSRVENPRVEVGCTEDGWLFVRDNGAGFDPQYSNKLFQPFERLHSVREFPGTGLGLQPSPESPVATGVRSKPRASRERGRPSLCAFPAPPVPTLPLKTRISLVGTKKE